MIRLNNKIKPKLNSIICTNNIYFNCFVTLNSLHLIQKFLSFMQNFHGLFLGFFTFHEYKYMYKCVYQVVGQLILCF